MITANEHPIAPEIEASTWINTTEPYSLTNMKGSVIAIHAFQMLCPGCVSHGIPQAKIISDTFSDANVHLIGLHTVFEHHAVMTVDALQAFVHEYRINFPIAVDRPSESGPIPRTMKNYTMKGTPSLILIDKNGRLRLNYFGRLGDMQVGKLISGLLAESEPPANIDGGKQSPLESSKQNCDEDGCHI